jgi:hypothetical protein
LTNQHCHAINDIERNNIQEKIIDLLQSLLTLSNDSTKTQNGNEIFVTRKTNIFCHGKVIEEVEDSWTEPIK